MRHEDSARDEEVGTESRASAERPAQGKRHKRGSTRPSLRREFMELFRDTRVASDDDTALEGLREQSGHDAPETPAPVRPPASTEAPNVWTGTTRSLHAPGPSHYLRRFLRPAALPPEPAPSGLATLDRHLGKGFGPGLHLVIGPAEAGKTAFLQSLAWEAVGSRRPVLYYALKTGSLRVWERLIATLSTILDGSAIVPSALRGRSLVPADREALTRLDAALQASVLPYLTLIDPVPGAQSSLGAFLEGVRSHSQEAAERNGRLPVVLVDDLDELLVLTGSHSPFHVLSRLDTALAADSIPGLLAATSDRGLGGRVDRLPVHTLVTLEPVVSPTQGSGRVDLGVRKNTTTGWTGTVPLLLDPSAGLFAETAAVRPRRR